MAPAESQEAEALGPCWPEEFGPKSWELRKTNQVSISGEENPERLEGLYPEHDQDSRSLGVAMPVWPISANHMHLRDAYLPLFVDLTKPVDVSTLTGSVLFPGLWKLYCSQSLFFWPLWSWMCDVTFTHSHLNQWAGHLMVNLAVLLVESHVCCWNHWTAHLNP